MRENTEFSMHTSQPLVPMALLTKPFLQRTIVIHFLINEQEAVNNGNLKTAKSFMGKRK